MKIKRVRVIAGILATSMILMNIPFANVHAMEETSGSAVVMEGPEVEKNETETSALEEVVPTVVQEETLAPTEERMTVEETISHGTVKYVYIESPYVETPATQRIVVALEQAIAGADSIALVVESDNGTKEEWQLSEQTEGLYLFEKEFSTEEMAGHYQVKNLVMRNALGETLIDCTGFDVPAEFGVNETYEGIEELKPVDGEESLEGVEASVVTIDEDGNAKAQDSIAEALAEVGAEMETQAVPASSFYSVDQGERSAKTGNVVVALDPGHDRNDAGAQANGLSEEVLTLKIANYCKAELEQYSGVSVYMTRTGPECPYNKPGISCMKDRVEAAARAGAKIFVSFHLNSSVASGAQGAEVIVPNNSWKAEVGSAGRALGEAILDELVSLGLARRQVYSKDTTAGEKYPDGSISDYFAVQVHCKKQGIPGLIIEHAFMTNASDANRFLKTEEGLKKLGIADATGIAKYLGLKKGKWQQVGSGYKFQLANGTYLKDQWLALGDDFYYLNKEGYRVTGWQNIGIFRYFFNNQGVMQKGWYQEGGTYYFFGPSGNMLTGWQNIGIFRYFFESNGKMSTGWKVIDGKKYYFGPSGNMFTGTQNIEGKEYYFDKNGVLMDHPIKTGWDKVGDTYYYYNAEGEKVTGWQYIGIFCYFFDKDGKMLTGWQDIGIFRYYFGPSGNMYVGWHEIGGKKYYFGPSGNMFTGTQIIEGKEYYFDKNGALMDRPIKNGWDKVGDTYYYYNAEGEKVTGWQYIGIFCYFFDKDGKMLTGWQDIGIFRYYFGPSGNMYVGWHEIGGKKYYFGPSGNMFIGDHVIDGKDHYFDANGVLTEKKHVGWKKVGDTYYYYNEDGKKVTGWQYIGIFYYFFDRDGKMLTGWQDIGIFRYYFGPSGNMYVGWHEIGGKKYYFGPSGNMFKGTQIIEGKEYEFDENGALIIQGSNGGSTEPDKYVGWKKVGDTFYFYDSNGKMVTGWQDIGIFRYYFDPSGKMLTGWQTLSGSQYYFGPSGNMYIGWERIEGKIYYFDSNGVYVPNKPTTAIMGKSTTTVDKMVRLYEQSGKKYPKEVMEKGGAPDIQTFCKIYFEEAEKEGVRAEVAFAQAMLETGNLQFGGDIKPEQYNFAGLGAVGGGAAGSSFPDVRIGARAHIQHLQAYASKEPLKNPVVDPRYQFVTRGVAPYVEWLGIQENPDGKGWATAKNYGENVMKLVNKL